VTTPIELILARQVASYLALPILLTDASGDTFFYNEPAEQLLGLPFDAVDQLSLADRARALTLRDESGTTIPFEDLPLVRALRSGRPDYRRLILRGLDGIDRAIEATAFPLTRSDGTRIGGVAIFWERPRGRFWLNRTSARP
jgi:PAS domain-containing protein